MPPVSGRRVLRRQVIARESNIVRVDFSREPEPPAPRFPGAAAMRNYDGGARDVTVVARARAAGQPCEMNLVLR